jgi:hypothetical protein
MAKGSMSRANTRPFDPTIRAAGSAKITVTAPDIDEHYSLT